jgi:hypothetical protein
MKSPSWLLALFSGLAALFAALGHAPPGAAQGGATIVHGLAPMPGGGATPEHLRPPGSQPDDGGPSPVVFPTQQLGIRFNHKKHVKELGLSCTTCHDRARTSQNSADSLIPPATRCDACHGSDHRDPAGVTADAGELSAQCGYCHLGYRLEHGNRAARVVIPAPNLKFNHALHARRNIGCAQCHGAVEELELATRDQLPRMRGCFNCHQMPEPARGDAPGACPTCHFTEAGGALKIEFASGKMLPPPWLHASGHTPDWIERHKKIAGDESRFCANCHSENYCTACHDGRVRPRRVHPNDWLSLHATAARQNNPTCTSCHQQQSFCLGCHQRAGVTLSGPYANFDGRGRFHPPKSVWTDGPRSPSHHAWEAQRNINACVSCHQERDCTTCHATRTVGGRGAGLSVGGGQGVNPHPRGFRDRCGLALRQNARPCLVCHDPADAALERCR